MTAAVQAQKWKRTPYQSAAILAARERRFFGLSWRRQGRKSSTLSEIAIDEMTAVKGRLVVYVSASLLLGREIIFKEAQVLNRVLGELSQKASDAGLDLASLDRSSGKKIGAVSDDDFADLFEAQRLELRLYHDRTSYSRTQVIAPNVATARGYSGTVLLDEYGFIRDMQDLWEAIEPIISTDATFKMIAATTPPKDDSHYSYEMTATPAGMEFTPNAKGNWYKSEFGMWVHRVDIHDAALAGVKLFDMETKAELTPQQHFARARDKDAWRRNYEVKYLIGGTSAVGLLYLITAQERGRDCAFFNVDSDSDFDRAVEYVQANLGPGRVGLGWDLATTEKGTSNPSAFTVLEESGVETSARAIVIWKTKDELVAEDRATRLIDAVSKRKEGGKARQLCIDSTNERYFASSMRRKLASRVPVKLMVGSETAKESTAEEMNNKQYLGSLLVSQIEDNRMTLPSDRYVKDDFRLVKKERGAFVCEPDSEGRHGDTFDSTKLALYALKGKATGYFKPVVYFRSKVARIMRARRERAVA